MIVFETGNEFGLLGLGQYNGFRNSGDAIPEVFHEFESFSWTEGKGLIEY